eukprot:1812758-Karenia_brevis.AAC.1
MPATPLSSELPHCFGAVISTWRHSLDHEGRDAGPTLSSSVQPCQPARRHCGDVISFDASVSVCETILWSRDEPQCSHLSVRDGTGRCQLQCSNFSARNETGET